MNLIKRIAIFVGLKAIEIPLFVFVPYCVGHFVMPETSIIEQWFIGVLFAGLGGVCLVAIGLGLAANWDWAGKILKK